MTHAIQQLDAPRLVLARDLTTGAELELPTKVVTAKNGVFGQSEGGKTFTMQYLAELMLRIRAKILVLTPVPNWWALKYLADGSPSPWEVVVFGGPKGDFPLSVGYAHTLARTVANEQINAVLDVSLLDELELCAFCIPFAREFHRQLMMTPNAMHAFFDEAQNFIPQEMSVKGQAEMRAAFIKLMREGRNFGLGWTIGSQRTQAVAKSAFGEIGTMICHRLISEGSIKPVREWVEDTPAAKESPKLFDGISTFEKGEAVIVSPAFLKVAGLAKIELKSTYDAGRTPDVGESIRELKARPPLRADALRKIFGDALKDAENSDPEALRRRIAGLEREVRELRAAQPQVISPELAELALQASGKTEHALELLNEAATELNGARLATTKIAETAQPSPPPRSKRAVVVQTSAPAPVQAVMREIPEAPPDERVEAHIGESDRVKKGARQMLVALAQFHPKPLSRNRVGTLSGIAKGTNTFSAYIGTLKRAGFVTESSEGLISITAAGRTHIGGGTRRPKTADELLELWGPKFKRGARAMLVALVKERRGFSREELGRAVVQHGGETPIQAGTNTFSSYLGELKRNGLAMEVGGKIYASQDFFPER